MVLKRRILWTLTCTLWLTLTSCSVNPFTTENRMSGSGAAAAAGGIIGAGVAALLGAPKSIIALAGIGGIGLGYYVTTLSFASGGVVQSGGLVYSVGDLASVVIPTDRIFDSNSSELLPQAGPILDSAVTVLRHYPNDNIMVSGNTSGFGTRKRERALSEARARQVAAYLWANGVNAFKATDMSLPTRKLIYVGYGNYFPVANDIRSDGIRSNSRIQITAFPSKKELQLDAHQRLFANIGDLNEPPLRVPGPTPAMDDGFHADALPDDDTVHPVEAFDETAVPMAG